MSMSAEDQLLGTLAELAGQIHHEGPGGTAAGPGSAPPALLDAVRLLDAATSLSGILGTLLQSARALAPDAALVLARDGATEEWQPPQAAVAPDKAHPGPPLDDARSVVDDAVTSGRASRRGAFVAVPLLMAGQAVAVLRARLEGEGADDRHATLEVLTRHAARCLEVVTAFRAARFLSRSPGATSARNGDDDQAARRYARLLVSEIKLYHEREIAEGQRQRDLVSRLGGEIARAQAMYDDRVPDDIRRGTDYFRAELVRTLAGGDASLLAGWPPRPDAPSVLRGS
jgi:hypothetical protein